MAMSDSFLSEFDHEMATTRKTLERVPDGKLQFKPHAKSYTLQQLASHVVNIVSWTKPTMELPLLDLTPPGGQPYTTPQLTSAKEMLAVFDQHIAEARAAIANTSDAKFMEPWSLIYQGKTAFTLPKVAVLRGFIMNHHIHHRAQLGVYLRLNDVAVPATYGPSADEGM
jgi:uncharacterized damage-inducible protein DinB